MRQSCLPWTCRAGGAMNALSGCEDVGKAQNLCWYVVNCQKKHSNLDLKAGVSVAMDLFLLLYVSIHNIPLYYYQYSISSHVTLSFPQSYHASFIFMALFEAFHWKELFVLYRWNCKMCNFLFCSTMDTNKLYDTKTNPSFCYCCLCIFYDCATTVFYSKGLICRLHPVC